MEIMIWLGLLLFGAVLLWDIRPVNPKHPGLDRINADLERHDRPPAGK